MNPVEAPYLSVVVTTRNDDHGGDPLKRLQALLNSFDAQCRRYRLDAELIVVEWNPPPDRPAVGSLLRLPDPVFCTYRFIEVPPVLHQRLQYSDVLPLFQMIAKNVGIRRARGRFVLATNIDIIFSNELVEYLSSGQLKEGHVYRVDRHDIQANVPIGVPLDAQMDYCQSHQLRVHTRWGTYAADSIGQKVLDTEDIVDGRTVRLGHGWHVREGVSASGFYRWASDSVELLVSGDAAEPDGEAVLDVDIESNPYDVDSWAEIVALEGEHALARSRVTGQVRLVVPLERKGPTTERRIELRLARSHAGSRRHLPAFERRDALHYRVRAARLRPASSADRVFEYPARGWTNAYEDSGVRLTSAGDALQIETDRRSSSYAVHYGPLYPTGTDLYRFSLECTVLEGEITVGVLSSDRTAWLDAAVNRQGESSARRYEISVDLRDRDRFWIVISNNHPDGDGVSRFTIDSLAGSLDPMLSESATQRRRWLPYWSAARVADAVARTIATILGHRLRYRVVRAATEFQAVEKALRASDRQVRNLAPLQYLTEFSNFLRDGRPDNLHVNGCGDFQLMGREHWEELRGYPEFETFSMNIDGLFSYIADAAGIKEQFLDVPIYHLEHEVGSGWSPEGEALLRKRIAERGITWLDASTVYIWAAYMKSVRRPMIFNDSNWGLADSTLPEAIHARAPSAASR